MRKRNVPPVVIFFTTKCRVYGRWERIGIGTRGGHILGRRRLLSEMFVRPLDVVLTPETHRSFAAALRRSHGFERFAFERAVHVLVRAVFLRTAGPDAPATSFAVPFAVIAAAADERFRNVALIYGAGDLPLVFAANPPSMPRALRRPVADVAMHSFTAFAPERFVDRIAPRPLVMVNGVDDPQMPAQAVRRLYDAAREPKTMIWLRTGHLMRQTAR